MLLSVWHKHCTTSHAKAQHLHLHSLICEIYLQKKKKKSRRMVVVEPNPCDPTSGPEVIKLFSCSAQLSMKFFQRINVKMPTIVGTLTFMSGKNSILGLSEPKKSRISWYFYTYVYLKFHAQLSWAWKKFYNLGARKALSVNPAVKGTCFESGKDTKRQWKEGDALCLSYVTATRPFICYGYSLRPFICYGYSLRPFICYGY